MKCIYQFALQLAPPPLTYIHIHIHTHVLTETKRKQSAKSKMSVKSIGQIYKTNDSVSSKLYVIETNISVQWNIIQQ